MSTDVTKLASKVTARGALAKASRMCRARVAYTEVASTVLKRDICIEPIRVRMCVLLNDVRIAMHAHVWRACVCVCVC